MRYYFHVIYRQTKGFDTHRNTTHKQLTERHTEQSGGAALNK